MRSEYRKTQEVVMEDAKAARLVASQLQAEIGDRRYQTWFDSRVQFKLQGKALLEVIVGSPLERDCLQRQFANELRTACQKAGEGARRVVYRIEPARSAPSQKTPSHQSQSRRTQTKQGPPTSAPAQTAQPRALAKPSAIASGASSHSSQHSAQLPATKPNQSAFANFVVGAGNSAATVLTQQIAIGQQVASPLLLWGPTGVGKTHLLHCIRDEVRRRKRRIRTVYLTAEQFTTGFVEAVHGRGLPLFRNKHRGVDLLLLDDLQFLIGKKKTIEEFQHTLDELLASGAQIVIASDRCPVELNELGSELASRLTGGVNVELASPDFDTRERLVVRQAEAKGLELTADVVQMVASGVLGGARELSGVLNRLKITRDLLDQPLDAALTRQVIDQTNRQTTPRVALADIQGAVCRVYGVDHASLRSDKRTKAATEPRMLAMWLARKYTRAAWSEIGAYFGRRSHSTVISACRRVDTLIDGQPTARAGDMQDALRRVETALRTG